MKLVTFTAGEHAALGHIDEHGHVRDLSGVTDNRPLLDVIDDWEHLRPVIDHVPGLPTVVSRRLLAPIPQPRRNLFAVGKNYRNQFGRSGYDQQERPGALPPVPVVFSKLPSTVIGPDEDIDPHLTVTSELDYEADLAVIIGPGGRGIHRDQAMDHVWGYTIIWPCSRESTADVHHFGRHDGQPSFDFCRAYGLTGVSRRGLKGAVRLILVCLPPLPGSAAGRCLDRRSRASDGKFWRYAGNPLA
ncbi:fumarylacetoacetate hydrolase family protein [Streptomyces sp. NPDC048409]|uniref:fumarylacetoacetate hydrolase family protein n=1 Tax=Streptomyces sp. NPDC048409 TaxID=3154723 RepID=UPI00341689B5